jgi:hypothetical protein
MKMAVLGSVRDGKWGQFLFLLDRWRDEGSVRDAKLLSFGWTDGKMEGRTDAFGYKKELERFALKASTTQSRLLGCFFDKVLCVAVPIN